MYELKNSTPRVLGLDNRVKRNRREKKAKLKAGIPKIRERHGRRDRYNGKGWQEGKEEA
jgi:hypothetical protein